MVDQVRTMKQVGQFVIEKEIFMLKSGYIRPRLYPIEPMPSGECEIGRLEPHAKWRCIYCGRPNWLDRLTCEGCGAPKGEL